MTALTFPLHTWSVNTLVQHWCSTEVTWSRSWAWKQIHDWMHNMIRIFSMCVIYAYSMHMSTYHYTHVIVCVNDLRRSDWALLCLSRSQRLLIPQLPTASPRVHTGEYGFPPALLAARLDTSNTEHTCSYHYVYFVFFLKIFKWHLFIY